MVSSSSHAVVPCGAAQDRDGRSGVCACCPPFDPAAGIVEMGVGGRAVDAERGDVELARALELAEAAAERLRGRRLDVQAEKLERDIESMRANGRDGRDLRAWLDQAEG